MDNVDLKVSPQREPVRRMRLSEFDRIIGSLREAHSQRRGWR